MKKMRNLLLVLSSATFIVACNTPTTDNTSDNSATKTDSTSFDIGKAKSAIADLNARFIENFKKGDSSGMASLYSSDAWAMPPNHESVKKENIASLWGGFMKMGAKDFKLSTDDVTGNAELVAETGNYEIYGDNNKLLDKGKYVVVWKPENGEWKLFRDIWNTSMPAAK